MNEFDAQQSELALNEALARVEEAAKEEWKEDVLNAIRMLAEVREYFTSDDVWMEVESPREPRALGAMMRQAKKLGWIEPTTSHVMSIRVACHRRPLRIWRSLIYKG
jgi:hypothetical protein